jgi:hypothetical protein
VAKESQLSDKISIPYFNWHHFTCHPTPAPALILVRLNDVKCSDFSYLLLQLPLLTVHVRCGRRVGVNGLVICVSSAQITTSSVAPRVVHINRLYTVTHWSLQRHKLRRIIGNITALHYLLYV